MKNSDAREAKEEKPATFVKWETIISPVPLVLSTNIVHSERRLRVRVREIAKAAPFRHFEVNFTSFPFFQSWQPLFQNSHWASFEGINPYIDPVMRHGPTLIVRNSPWISSCSNDPLFQGFYGKVEHYVIFSANRVVEVLSHRPPDVIETESLTLDALKDGRAVD